MEDRRRTTEAINAIKAKKNEEISPDGRNDDTRFFEEISPDGRNDDTRFFDEISPDGRNDARHFFMV